MLLIFPFVTVYVVIIQNIQNTPPETSQSDDTISQKFPEIYNRQSAELSYFLEESQESSPTESQKSSSTEPQKSSLLEKQESSSTDIPSWMLVIAGLVVVIFVVLIVLVARLFYGQFVTRP